MRGFVDLHSHVLPAIDDGARDLTEALAMLRAAAASGTTTIAATPHLSADFPGVRVDELACRCRQLRDAAAAAGIAVRLVAGAEVSLAWALRASAQERVLASYDQRGTDLLIETPSHNVVGLDMVLYDLRVSGCRITLAHPERSVEFQRHPNRLVALVDQGVLLQVDAASLLTRQHRQRRSGANSLARHLCVSGLAHALASDGHRSSSWRPVTDLAKAADVATALVGAARAEWMTSTAPAAIIAGTPLSDSPAVVTARKRHRRLWRR